MNPDVPIEDHAVLSVPAGIYGITIDGEAFKSGFTGSDLSIVLPPGEHTIQGMYAVSDGDTETRSDFITIVHNFKAGGRYYILARTNITYTGRSSLWDTTVGSGTINFVIVDETDPAAAWAGTRYRPEWAEERVTWINNQMGKIRYPSKLALSFTYIPLMVNAANAGPTKFEGAWTFAPPRDAWLGNQTYSYRFTGNFYFLDYDNSDSHRSSLERGTFEFNDNTITLTALQSTGIVIRGSNSLVNLPRPTITQYEYSITDEGLVLRTSRGTLGPFTRTEPTQ